MTDEVPEPLIKDEVGDATALVPPVPPAPPAIDLSAVVNQLLQAEPQFLALFTNVKNLENSALGAFIPANLRAVLDNPLLAEAIEYVPKFVPFLQQLAPILAPAK